MFQGAIKTAKGYTYPVIISFQRKDGKTDSNIGTFIVLNEDGYILTAHHIVEGIIKMREEIETYIKYKAVKEDTSLSASQKNKKLMSIPKPKGKNPVTKMSILWGHLDWHVGNFQANKAADVAIGKNSRVQEGAYILLSNLQKSKG